MEGMTETQQMRTDAPTNQSIVIHHRLKIPVSELSFRYSRSSGPGGQNVNRRETRVELLFDVPNSPSLTPQQKSRLLERLAGQMDSEGVLRLVVESERSQLRNRQEALARFTVLLQTALRRTRRRVPTEPSAVSIARRVDGKRRRGQLKQKRRKLAAADEE